MPNINMELPEELHKKVKIAALMSDTSLKDYVINVLEKRAKTKNRLRKKR